VCWALTAIRWELLKRLADCCAEVDSIRFDPLGFDPRGSRADYPNAVLCRIEWDYSHDSWLITIPSSFRVGDGGVIGCRTHGPQGLRPTTKRRSPVCGNENQMKQIPCDRSRGSAAEGIKKNLATYAWALKEGSDGAEGENFVTVSMTESGLTGTSRGSD
jgi:hypothetical protein